MTKSSFTWQKQWVRTFQERGHIIVCVNYAYRAFWDDTDQFLDSYVSLRNSFTDHMCIIMVLLEIGLDPKMHILNATFKLGP